MGAKYFERPAFAMPIDEAQKVAQAIAGVTRHYDISVSAKAADFARLAVVLGTSYGKRVLDLTKPVAPVSSPATDRTRAPDQPINVGGVLVFPNFERV